VEYPNQSLFQNPGRILGPNQHHPKCKKPSNQSQVPLQIKHKGVHCIGWGEKK